jgi:betaine lipid synthase
MASLIPSILPVDPHLQILAVGVGIFIIIGIVFATTLRAPQKDEEQPNAFLSLLQFIYACFLKPHDGDGAGGQQAALESFYKAQANVYDSTRRSLLRGREDMLALVAAQLTQNQKQRKADQKLIWVDVSTLESD